MTEILCYEDSYLKEFDAEVTAVTDKGVVLDRTAFYPGGGGQPFDTGTLSSSVSDAPTASMSTSWTANFRPSEPR